MIDFMTWSEIVDNLLQESSLKMAAIFDLGGVRLAASEGVSISEEEAQGLLHSLHVPCPGMFALFLGGAKVSCFRLDERTLIGRTSSEVVVAHRTDNVLICGYSTLEANSSCLGSIKDFALKLGMQPTCDGGVAPSSLM
ncbi:uncharacterized protein LOC143280421 [Babylonia areolata]|uniref:uncharacterized protein LOC143280421 n=1 Tax=Babylonia areolata TaxID=304850 RepID=UPI003FD474BB